MRLFIAYAWGVASGWGNAPYNKFRLTHFISSLDHILEENTHFVLQNEHKNSQNY